MDTPKLEKRFIFHGNAVAFAGHIRRPDDVLIPAVASSCLPVTGGLAEGTSGPKKFGPQHLQEMITFESATSRAHGDYADVRRAADFTHGNHGDNDLATNTIVESTLQGLKIQMPLDPVGSAPAVHRKFAVGALHVRMESTSDRRSPTSFRALETVFDGITVDDKRLKIHSAAEVFSQHDTFAKLNKAYEEDGKFRKQYGSLFYPTGREKTGLGGLLSKHEIPQAQGTVVGTVVTGLEWEGQEAADTVIAGNRLSILGIGTIFFGEIILQENFRRVTLLRFHLGSTSGADAAACEIQSNGQGWPPALDSD